MTALTLIKFVTIPMQLILKRFFNGGVTVSYPSTAGNGQRAGMSENCCRRCPLCAVRLSQIPTSPVISPEKTFQPLQSPSIFSGGLFVQRAQAVDLAT